MAHGSWVPKDGLFAVQISSGHECMRVFEAARPDLRDGEVPSAARLFGIMRGSTPLDLISQPEVAEPPWQSQRCPVFSDGGVSNPRFPDFALGGAGIWTERTGSHMIKQGIAVDLSPPVGTTWAAPLVGPIANSTRAELLGVLASTYVHGAAHTCIDAKAVVNIYNRYYEFHRSLPLGGWAMIRDGDLEEVWGAREGSMDRMVLRS